MAELLKLTCPRCGEVFDWPEGNRSITREDAIEPRFMASVARVRVANACPLCRWVASELRDDANKGLVFDWVERVAKRAAEDAVTRAMAEHECEFHDVTP